MTKKDYAVIQRNIGFIEGVLCGMENDSGALDCIALIDTILDKEVLTDE